jgi:hypothetical protein
LLLMPGSADAKPEWTNVKKSRDAASPRLLGLMASTAHNRCGSELIAEGSILWTRAYARDLLFWGLGQGLAPWSIFSKMMAQGRERIFRRAEIQGCSLARGTELCLDYGRKPGFVAMLVYGTGRSPNDRAR